MKTPENQELLTEYAKNGSETAFRELVASYIDLVYSTGLRVVGGDRQLAEDVTQTVFVQLARKAHKLSPEVMLGGWLHRATYNVAATLARGERRRRLRERQAAEINAMQAHTDDNLAKLAPILDEAIEELGANERAAVLLRFFEQREFGSMGEALGLSEDGARKRVGRALDRLQSILKRRGVTLSTTALAAMLGAQAVTAAPAGLATTVAATALAGVAAGGGTTFALLKVLTMTKLKIAALGAVVVASVITPVVVQQQNQAKLAKENQSLRQQLARLDQLEAENGRLANVVAQASNDSAVSTQPHLELLRLRGEVAQLRAAARELEDLKRNRDENVVQNALRWKERETKLRALLQQMPNRTIPEFYLLGDRDISDAARDANLDTEDGIRTTFFHLRARAMNMFAVVLQPALKKYTDEHNGQPPAAVGELGPYFQPPVNETVLQRYIVRHFGTNQVEGGWSGGWVVTQKEPVDGVDSRWFISPVGFSTGQFETADAGQ